MDAFLTSFVAVLLAEMGDRSQLLAAALALRFHRNGAIIAGLALASLLNCAIAAAGGSVIDEWISEAPLTLFGALAYIFAGVGMLWWRRPVDILANWRTGSFLTSFLGLFILQFGDKSQFLLAANAARSDGWGFVMAGGWAGIMAASIPAILLREKLAKMIPVNAIRRFSGVLFLVIGAYMALRAFDLIA